MNLRVVPRDQRAEAAVAVVDVRAQPLGAEKALEVRRRELWIGGSHPGVARATIEGEDPGTVPVQPPRGQAKPPGFRSSRLTSLLVEGAVWANTGEQAGLEPSETDDRRAA